jgi:8-oxo-dGTP diphosphatase
MNASPSVIIVVAAVIERDGLFLVTRRQAGSHLEGYWEFPGGKCHPGEAQKQALRREIQEELDVEIVDPRKVLETRHAYPDRVVELHFYRCSLAGTPRPLLGQELLWVSRGDLETLKFPPADAELIAKLAVGNVLTV